MKEIKEFENGLLKRKEIEFVLESESNPGISDAIKKVAEKFGVHEERVVLKKLEGKFGMKEFYGKAFIYKSKEDRASFEPKIKVKKVKEAGK